MKSPRRSDGSGWTERYEAATTPEARAGLEPVAVHEAAHAVVAVLLGLRARAVLHRMKRGHGSTDIDAPPGPGGDERLLVALVAGAEGEGRLLQQRRRPEPTREDAKAIARIVGPLEDAAAIRVARAKRHAAQLLRDRRVWAAVEAVAWQLAERGLVEDAFVREAIGMAGLRSDEERR